MPGDNDNQRESIWGLRQLSLVPYYLAFAGLFVLATGLYLWRGFATAEAGAHVVDTALSSLKEASGLTPWLIIFTYYLVEGLSMLAEKYLRSRYAKGKEEGLEEKQQQWLAWNQRRLEALREGREFTEPTPENKTKG